MLKIINNNFLILIRLNLQYDAVGNLITGDSFYREYDGFNNLIRIRQGNTSSGNISEEFIWHPLEERVFIKKIYWNNQTLRTTIKYLNKNTIKIKNESGIFYENYIYQDDILVAQRDANGNKQAIHNDHLGSVSLITDSSGNVVENEFFSPYGEQIQAIQASRYSFTGKEFDTVTGHYDFMSRMAKPDWANRFIQVDRIFYDFNKYEQKRLIAYYDSQSLNPYAYARNNPYNRVDPDGQFWQLLIPGIVGAAIATGAYLLTHDDYSFGQGLEYAEAGFIGATIGTYGGILGSSSGAVISQVLINDAENRPLNENLKEAATIGAFTFGIGEVFLPAINPRNLKYFQSYFTKKTGQKILGRESVLEIFGWSLGMQNLGTVSNINRYSYQINQITENLIQQMRQEGSSRAIFGSSGGSGFVSGIGYVTSGGSTYPTTNPNFVPNPNVPRVCISGC